MSIRNDRRTLHSSKTHDAEGGTPFSKSRAETSGKAAPAKRADEKRAFLTRLERSRTSLFHGSD